METTNDTQNPGLSKPAFQYAIIMALGLILISLIFYLLGHPTSRLSGLLAYPVIIAVLIFGIIKFRDEFNGGAITYGSSLGLGTLIGLFAGLIVAVFTFVFYKFIAPELLDVLFVEAKNSYLEREPTATASELALYLRLIEFILTPIMLSLATVFSTTFFAFIFSLIISIFVKRKPIVEAN